MSRDAPGERILALWNALERWPAGDRVFSFLLGRVVPYSGTVTPRIRILMPGRCRAEMRDRRRVRNHLGSVHATALATVGELVTGLSVITALPRGIRGIPTTLEAEYEKKARGRLTAYCRTELPDLDQQDRSVDHRVTAEIRDEQHSGVARVRTTWRLSPTENG